MFKTMGGFSKEVINELSILTGKNISDEKKDKIINAIVNDKVPKDIDTKF